MQNEQPKNAAQACPTPFFVRAGEVMRGACNDAARAAWFWYPAASTGPGQPMTPQDKAVAQEVALMMDLATRLLESMTRLEVHCRSGWSRKHRSVE